MLVGVTLPAITDDDTEASLDELALLIDTAGADEVGPHASSAATRPTTPGLIGKGKVEELRELCLAVDADTVVFDNELAPAQQYNLEKVLGRTALDRTAVILDIFAQNAHTLEGKAQVELALLRYRLPRLRRGARANLSQQRGGIGTRIRARARRSSRSTADASCAGSPSSSTSSKELRRDAPAPAQEPRPQRARPRVTIVGYTNAGKSTLLNRLTHAGVLVEDRLFATLDPTTRRLSLPGRRAGAAHRHGRLRAHACRTGSSRRSRARSRSRRGRPARPRRRRHRARSRGRRSPRCATVLGEIDAPAGARAARRSTRPTSRPTWPSSWSPTTRARSRSAPSPARASTTFLADRRPIGSDRSPTIVELLIPYDRGDVLASVHREGEVRRRPSHEDGGVRVRARLGRRVGRPPAPSSSFAGLTRSGSMAVA